MITYEAIPYGVFVHLVTTPEEYKEVVGTDPWDGVLGTTEWTEDGDICIYWIDENIATLVHEMVHASLFILDHVGIDPQSNQGECQAYLMDNMYTYLTEGIMAKKPSPKKAAKKGKKK